MRAQTIGNARRAELAQRNRIWAEDLRELANCRLINPRRCEALTAAADMFEATATAIERSGA